jgi:hypothetical protein
MGRDVGGAFPKDNGLQIKNCGTVTDAQNRLHCLDGAVQNSFWDLSGQDLATDFCHRLTNENEKHGCFNTIFERATQLVTTPSEGTTFCAKVEPSYQKNCLYTVLHES